MNNNIDWKDVENKISLICARFPNLTRWHEDLSQELRIHAYYVSDNYYDLFRKAIDYWRRLQTRETPEVPYFDLEVLGKESMTNESFSHFDTTVSLIEKELTRPGYGKWDNDMMELSRMIFDIIKEDIDDRIKPSFKFKDTSSCHYRANGINLSWVSSETNVSYKRLVAAMRFLEDTVKGLAVMGKIEIPEEILKDYYKN